MIEHALPLWAMQHEISFVLVTGGIVPRQGTLITGKPALRMHPRLTGIQPLAIQNALRPSRQGECSRDS